MNKGFTLIELVIVLAIISIISAVLLPKLVNSYDEQKAEIIDIYNGHSTVKIDKDTGETIQDTDGYTLVDVDTKDGTVYMYFEKK